MTSAESSPRSREPLTTPFRIGAWWVHPRSGEVRRGGHAERLQPRVMEVLAYLAARQGEVVAKEELLADVWREEFVGDDAVWRCIAELRKVLEGDRGDGGDGEERRVIETLPRRGYRLVPPVEPAVGVGGRGHGDEAAAPAAGRRRAGWTGALRRPRVILVAGVLGAAIVALLLAAGRGPGFGFRAGGAAGGVTDGGAEDAATGLPPEETLAAGAAALARSYHRVGMTHYYQRGADDLERALVLFRKAVSLDPEYAPAHAALANAYASKYLLVAQDEAWLGQAEEAARTAVRLRPDGAEARRALGLVRQAQGRLGDARRQYLRALEADPDNYPVRHNLALLALAGGRLAEAWRWIDRLEPPSLLARSNRLVMAARVHYLLGDAEAARRTADAARQLVPCAVAADALLARLDLVQGRPDAVRQRVERCLEMGLHASDQRFLLGTAALAEGDFAAARDSFRASGLDPRRLDPGTALQVLTALDGAGDREAAEDLAVHLRAGGRRGPEVDDPALLHAAAGAHALGGDAEAALRLLARAVEAGFRDTAWLRLDPAFASLAGDGRFRTLVARAEARVDGQRRRLAAVPAR